MKRRGQYSGIFCSFLFLLCIPTLSFNLSFLANDRTPKIVLHYTPPPGSSSAGHIKVGFSSGGRDAISTSLSISLKERAWDTPTPKNVDGRSGIGEEWTGGNRKETSEEFSTRSAGIAGLMEKQKKEISADESVAAEAFSDLTKLMDMAHEVVKLAEKYAQEKSKNMVKSDDDQFESLVRYIILSSFPLLYLCSCLTLSRTHVGGQHRNFKPSH
jgi:hypothetical protein